MKKKAALDGNDRKRQGMWKDVWRRFRKNKAAMLGLFMFLLILAAVAFANLIMPYEKAVTGVGLERLQPPSAEHWFGTDQLGRDELARILHGGRISLLVGIVPTVISVAVGAALGAAGGYYGGRFDDIVMRLLDVINCIPGMLLMLAIVAAMGAGMFNLIVALTISGVPGIARLVRSTVIGISDMEYIQAARAYGTPDRTIIRKHVLPNAMGPIIITAAGMVASTIITAASLSFLGFGVQPPAAEWGAMLSDAKGFMREAPHMMIFPGACIVLSAMAINLMGDGLRDALDPRLKD